MLLSPDCTAQTEGRQRLGVAGLVRHSNMITSDRETETLWQQLTGRALAGKFSGEQLEALPVQVISLEQFAASFPDGLVLSRETGYRRLYGTNPYPGYHPSLAGCRRFSTASPMRRCPPCSAS